MTTQDTNADKKSLLESLRQKIAEVQQRVVAERTRINELALKPLSEIRSMLPEDQTTAMRLRGNAQWRLQELEQMNKSPFFTKCDITYEKTGKSRAVYFGKHQFTEENIYSWVAPIAAIRFEQPGPVSYKLPRGVIEKGTLEKKDSYMIVDGQVLFYATEAVGSPRDLIYQEHFSAKRQGFMLPEIVSVMEKAQDQVIRAHHIGAFVISGPAGSGKTTLALHRVAYLVQAPDTAEKYPRNSVIVFVQDNGTKEYFSHLLPELGITNVKITTFYEWASEILQLDEIAGGDESDRSIRYVPRRGADENERNRLEYDRLQKLRAQEIPTWTETKAFLKKQSAESSSGIDRIDLTIALSAYFNHHKKFETKHAYMTPGRDGELIQKTRRNRLKYSLMVVDEFQNYMPEQLRLLNACIDPETQSTVYVGDMAQQVYPGTIRSWADIGLAMGGDREVRLHKVYRNTRQILEYIRKLGYSVEIPEGLKQGPEVSEVSVGKNDSSDAIKETIEHIEALLKTKQGIIGVIGKTAEDVSEIKKHFAEANGAAGEPRIHAVTMAESQGVEFDIVCIVGVREGMFSLEHLAAAGMPQEFIDERRRIERDLLYVALTRAISEMHLVGSCALDMMVQK
ncbi:MAG: helicase [Candidatus Taylorbacteria bacterium]|nr:helicase [Candidatus Taylorbacteria bacterium]